jgi:hypothetical protein
MWRACLSFHGKYLNKKKAIFIFSQSFYTWKARVSRGISIVNLSIAVIYLIFFQQILCNQAKCFYNKKTLWVREAEPDMEAMSRITPTIQPLRRYVYIEIGKIFILI